MRFATIIFMFLRKTLVENSNTPQIGSPEIIFYSFPDLNLSGANKK